jgi:putative tricarboxylic transport membrane protein
MRNDVDLGASVFLILIGGVVMIGALGLGLGTAEQIRPGFMPFLCGIILTVLSLLLFFSAWRGRTGKFQPLGEWRRPLTVLIGLMVYVILFNLLGYVISTAILSVIILRVFDMRSKGGLLLVSLGIAVGTFVLFNSLLGVELPAGILTILGR